MPFSEMFKDFKNCYETLLKTYNEDVLLKANIHLLNSSITNKLADSYTERTCAGLHKKKIKNQETQTSETDLIPTDFLEDKIEFEERSTSVYSLDQCNESFPS